MLVATNPLFAQLGDLPTAEFALATLGRVRYLSVASLLALVGPRGEHRVPELIEDWVKAGLVHRGRVLRNGALGDVVDYLALTSKGARAVEDVTGQVAQGLAPARLRREGRKTNHDLSVGEVAAAFLALAEEKRIDLGGVEVDDKKIATSVLVAKPGAVPDRVALQPDALVMVNSAAGPTVLLVEVDKGTTGLEPKLLRKFEGYLEWQRQGLVSDYNVRSLRVLTLAPSERRLTRLHDTALKANGGKRSGFLLFGLLEDVTVANAERVFGPSARQLGSEPNHRVPIVSRSFDMKASAA
jgi:hypothetical protein